MRDVVGTSRLGQGEETSRASFVIGLVGLLLMGRPGYAVLIMMAQG